MAKKEQRGEKSTSKKRGLTRLFGRVIGITIPAPELSFASLCDHRSGYVVRRVSRDDRIQMERIKAKPIAVYIIDYREMGKTAVRAGPETLHRGMHFGSFNIRWAK